VNEPLAALQEAGRRAGVDVGGATLIRQSENTLYRLPGGVVARVTRPGQQPAAAKEVRVSHWLDSVGVSVVQALTDVAQPVVAGERAVTFWRELPPHRYSTLPELAEVLRRLHALAPPDFALPPLAPFVRLRERLTEAGWLPEPDRAWLLAHLVELEARYAALPPGLPSCAVHGDAWAGNVVVTDTGPVLLDLERFALGAPEWDLASLAVTYQTFGDYTRQEWTGFCTAYGADVTAWDGFPVLRDIRELRKVTFAIQLGPTRPDIAEQARYRLRCLQGKAEPRPWKWVGVP
jgi:aminoglycoside phosphotransferase (APT) family kinase protein